MRTTDVTLGIPDWVLSRLRDGTCYRDGGVVRERGSQRLVAFLSDVDVQETDLAHILDSSFVPLALHGLSAAGIDHRLARVEAELNNLREQIADVAAGVAAANVKLDGQLLGHLRGSLVSYRLEIRTDRDDRLLHYRETFLQAYMSLTSIAVEIARSPSLLKRNAEALARFAAAAHLAGLAARDASVRLDDAEGLRELSQMLANDGERLAHEVTNALNAPSALQWIEPQHRRAAVELRESAHRLRGHVAMVELGIVETAVLDR